MQYRTLGRSGLQVSVVGLGSWLTFGHRVKGKAVRAIVDRALSSGVVLIDTADVYMEGRAEEELGHALAGVARASYVLASKCFFPVGPGPNDRGLSRKHVFESIEGSLARLRTDYLDLYQCHRYDEHTPLEETARAMDDLCRQGKLLYWGVSDWTAEQIRAVTALCRERGYVAPISNQPPYSMYHRAIEAEVLPACSDCGMSNVVFSPLAQGVLTGKYLPGRTPPEGSRAADSRGGRFVERYRTEAHLAVAQELKGLAEGLGTSLAVLALAWCLRRPEVASVLVGATSVGQLEENLRASEFEIPADAAARIEELLRPLPVTP
ncbi:MAG: aldo/keto reductase family protein [Planctomycetota bacterium]